tara:strand:+ start:1910 stop:2221 length:312 start_codon:yes stop_codon:yes gene_type:complete
MAILIIRSAIRTSPYEADAAVLHDGRILLASDASEKMAEDLDRQIKMYREMIADDNGKPATGDELLEGVASRWNNQVVQSRIFSDDEVDEAEKYLKESGMNYF